MMPENLRATQDGPTWVIGLKMSEMERDPKKAGHLFLSGIPVLRGAPLLFSLMYCEKDRYSKGVVAGKTFAQYPEVFIYSGEAPWHFALLFLVERLAWIKCRIHERVRGFKPWIIFL